MLSIIELVMVLAALGVSAALRPWRMLRGPLGAPWVASWVLLSLLWVLPQNLPAGISIQLSGACLLVLMFGWPLAMIELVLIALAVWLFGQLGWTAVLSQLVWIGLVPATLALALGEVLRCALPPHPFIYVLGRAFIGTALCLFLAGVAYEFAHHLIDGVAMEQALVARWLMAWGDAFITGMLVAIFVAFRPQWLATYADHIWLLPPPPDRG